MATRRSTTGRPVFKPHEEEVRRIFCDLWNNERVRKGEQRIDFTKSGMPSWDGGTSSMGRRYNPIWPKLTAFLNDNRLDPREYIEWVLEHRKQDFGFQPAQLQSAEWVRKYRLENFGPEVSVGQMRVAFLHLYEGLEQRVLSLSGENHSRLSVDQLTATALTKYQPDTVFSFVLGHALGLRRVLQQLYGVASARYLTKKWCYDAALPADLLTPELKTILGNYKEDRFDER